METKISERPFLAEVTLERTGEKFRARAYPPPPDAEDKPRYVVKDPDGNEVELELAEKMEFDRLIFGKPEPEDVFKLEEKQRKVTKTSKRR